MICSHDLISPILAPRPLSACHKRAQDLLFAVAFPLALRCAREDRSSNPSLKLRPANFSGFGSEKMLEYKYHLRPVYFSPTGFGDQ